ncbi:hypothetical protein [Kitasatospora griseola]|uniref:hypothetical protein n=1 Tax=Kitasatospora griseola TaxID=2064 RepID=UPI003424598D
MTDTERAELAQRFDTLGRALAAELDTVPTMEPGWHHQVQAWASGAVTLYHPTGLAIQLAHERWNDAQRGRLTVRGLMPHDWSGRDRFEIGVSAARPPADIARDIRRRLLPDYMAALPGAQAEVAASERLRLARIAAMQSLVEVLPALHTYDWDNEQSAGSYYGEAHNRPERAHGNGTVRVNHSALSVDLKLTGVPLHLALRVLALLRRPDADGSDTEPART